MSVGQASGLAMAEAAARGCEVAQYSPNEVKQAVAGYGAATKEQVQRMVQTLLGLAAPPTPADAADAAALALCHLASAPLREAAARAEPAGRRPHRREAGHDRLAAGHPARPLGDRRGAHRGRRASATG